MLGFLLDFQILSQVVYHVFNVRSHLALLVGKGAFRGSDKFLVFPLVLGALELVTHQELPGYEFNRDAVAV